LLGAWLPSALLRATSRKQFVVSPTAMVISVGAGLALAEALTVHLRPWMYYRMVFQQLSSHYTTGKPLQVPSAAWVLYWVSLATVIFLSGLIGTMWVPKPTSELMQGTGK
jgi:hypothetical protein